MGATPPSMERTYPVLVHNRDAQGRIRFGCFVNMFQDIAAAHADSLGFGGKDLLKDNLIWMATRSRVIVHRYPHECDSLVLRTWTGGVERNLAMRQYQLRTHEGEVVASSVTGWAVVDVVRRRMVSPTTVNLPEESVQDTDLGFATKALGRVKEPEHQLPFLTRAADMDMNQHVNNAVLTNLALEPIPEHVMNELEIMEMDIGFRRECVAGEHGTSVCAAEQGTDTPTYLQALLNAEGKELVRARTVLG